MEAENTDTVSYEFHVQQMGRELIMQVADLKKKVFEQQTFPVENQKIIYSGQLCRASTSDKKLTRLQGKS